MLCPFRLTGRPAGLHRPSPAAAGRANGASAVGGGSGLPGTAAAARTALAWPPGPVTPGWRPRRWQLPRRTARRAVPSCRAVPSYVRQRRQLASGRSGHAGRAAARRRRASARRHRGRERPAQSHPPIMPGPDDKIVKGAPGRPPRPARADHRRPKAAAPRRPGPSGATNWLIAWLSSAVSSTPLRSRSSSAEGASGLVGVDPVDRRQPGVFPGIEHAVAVGVSHLDQGPRGGARGGVESGAVPDFPARRGDEFVPGDHAVAVGVHVREHPVEQGAQGRGHPTRRRGVGGVAEGLAQPPGRQLVVAGVEDPVPVGVDGGEATRQHRPRRGGPAAPAGRRPGQDRGQQDGDDHQDRQPGREYRRPSHPGTAQRLQQELHAHERADHGQASGQVDDPAQHPGHQHVQLPEPHQGEHVAGQHQGGAGGDAEDRRDRVEGEQHVGQPDGHHRQDHRRDRPPGPRQVLPQPRGQPGMLPVRAAGAGR